MDYKDEICHFKRTLQDASYCCKAIIRLNEDLAYKEHELTGLARHGTDLTPEQEKSPLPMPHYRSSRSLVDRIFELDAIKTEIDYYRLHILECETIERLAQEDKDLLIRIFVFRENRWDIATELGISRQGLDKRVNQLIKKCL